MKFNKTYIEGLIVIEPEIHKDKRGYFFESFRENDFPEYHFVQDNQSKSVKGVLRGIHFQSIHMQAKLVSVIKGRVFDVAVDLRKGSETFGRWFGMVLSAKNKKQLLIPRGFGHGFLVLSKTAEFAYKCDDYYFPKEQDGIKFDDCNLDIQWPQLDCPYILSEKDLKLQSFEDFKKKIEV